MTARKRKDVLSGKTLKAATGCGSMYLTLNTDEGELVECRLEIGKSGGCTKNMLSVIGILYSILLQSGIEKEIVIKTVKRHLLGVSCGEPFITRGKTYKSCLDWAARKILEELKSEVSEERSV